MEGKSEILRHLLKGMKIGDAQSRCIASRQQGVLATVGTADREIDEEFLIKVEKFFNTMAKGSLKPDTITLTYEKQKYVIKRLASQRKFNEPLYLIVNLPASQIYFRRAVKQTVKNFQLIFP